MTNRKQLLTGMGQAILATLIWSGNYIVARGVHSQISPVSLAFFRWLTASLLLLPMAPRVFRTQGPLMWKHRWKILVTALTGVSLFNTFIYVGGHSTTAINLALIGTTAAPVFSIVLARIFLREQVGLSKIAGVILCFGGILLLISQGDWRNLPALRFSAGDLWVLLAAFWFAVYTLLARTRPAELAPLPFLAVCFWTGTLLLFPAYWIERTHFPPIRWTGSLAGIVLYLGAGASILAFYLWNLALPRLGAGRTALLGNLIPLFSTVEAVILLGETFRSAQAYGMALILAGVLTASVPVLLPARFGRPGVRGTQES
ncbi:MAG TPA: DMT family transporter [Chitinophagaceae bacterium]|nr:DMT family transporter [Chitinophagaceae bacterium]